MDVSKFYADTIAGEKVDSDEVLRHIAGFDTIVIWGASWLGQTIGAYLLAQGIDFAEYWDLRAGEINDMNGKKVRKPFSSDYSREKTLIISCISNAVVQSALRRTLDRSGYHQWIAGFNIYMAAICPSDKESGLDMDFCANSKSCLKIYCARMSSLFSLRWPSKDQAHVLNLPGITLVVNQICNLSCKHCTSYMHAYPQSERINFPIAEIIRDIHSFFNSVDSVASMTVMGGEPFMHPDLSAIMRAVLAHDNIGFISISTNGVFPIKAEQLNGLEDRRVIVAFNNYLPSLPDSFSRVFTDNVELVKKSGIHYSVGNFMPNWSVPSTLYNLHRPDEETFKRIKQCRLTNHVQFGISPLHRQIKNGKLYSCDFANALHSLGIADYPDDYVDLRNATELRERLHKHYTCGYFRTCGHCRGLLGPAGASAVQGKIDYITPPVDELLTEYIPG